MDDIFEGVGDFFKAMVALAVIIGIMTIVIGILGLIFGGVSENNSTIVEQEFSARCESVGGTRSSNNCYKDGEVVFNKEQE